MPIELGRRLIASGICRAEEVEAALFLSVVRGVPFARVLIDRGALTERQLDEELERVGGLGLRRVVPAADLVARLPRAMCRRLGALPTQVDSITGVVDVAAADPLDPHIAAEFGFQFGAPIRVLRAPLGALEEAIRELELGADHDGRTRVRRATPPSPHGAPQSTIPPPPGDEMPIPLVRRIEAEPETREMSTRRLPQRDDEDVVLPLRNSKVGEPTPRPSAYLGSAVPSRSAEQPAVSFPSEPPRTLAQTRPSRERWDAMPVERASWNGATLAMPPAAPDEESDSAAPSPVEIAAPRLPRDLMPIGVDASRDVSLEGLPERSVDESAPPSRRTARPPLLADFDRQADSRTLTSAVMAGAHAAPPLSVVAPAPSPASPRRGSDVPTAREGRPRTLPPPFGSPDADESSRLLRSVRDAPNRDELVRLSLRGLRRVARRVAVFAVRKDGYQGWACNVEFGDQDALKQIHVPGDVPSVLATAAATSFYLGPITSTPGHAALLQVLGSTTVDVAAVAVRVGGRAAMIFVADELESSMHGTRFIDELGRAASEGLSRLLGR